MSTGKVAVRYAKALFLSAKEQNLLDRARNDMELFLKTVSEIPEIRLLLESPILDSSKKAKALSEIFGKNMNKLSLDLLRLTANNKREEYLPGIARYFVKLYKEEKGIQVATITSAVKLDEGSADQIREMVRKAFKTEIELEQKVKEDLIGGFVLRVENKQLDASVKGKLSRIKKELQK